MLMKLFYQINHSERETLFNCLVMVNMIHPLLEYRQEISSIKMSGHECPDI